MMTDRLKRINALAAKAKAEGLTEEELAEQAVLWKEYLAAFRANFKGILDHTSIQRPDGAVEPLQPKKKS